MHDGISAVVQFRQHVRTAGEVGDDHVAARCHEIDATHVGPCGTESLYQAPSDTPAFPVITTRMW